MNPSTTNTQAHTTSTPVASAMVPAMALALRANFGSVEAWREELVALAAAQHEPGGWLLLCFEPQAGTLAIRCQAAATSDPAGPEIMLALPLAAVDTAAGSDVGALVDGIDWDSVYTRYQHAVHAASEAFGASRDELAGTPSDDPAGALRIDVRRAGVFEQAATMLPGARWRDPAEVGRWAAELPADRPVLVYCVYGHEVGRATAMRLRAAGVDARYLQGGIDGWLSAGLPVVPRGEPS